MTIDKTNMCSHLQRKLFEEDGQYHVKPGGLDTMRAGHYSESGLFFEDDRTGLGGMVENEDFVGFGLLFEVEYLEDDHEVAASGKEHDDADPEKH